MEKDQAGDCDTRSDNGCASDGGDGRQEYWQMRRANSLHAGCWASSGYSVQGCAQLEQKLRQCMDAPVGLATYTIQHIAHLASATRTRRRTTSTITSRGCIPRSKDPTSGIDDCRLTARALYIICRFRVRRLAQHSMLAFDEFYNHTIGSAF